ncbi:hypothetical protein GOODEAATRI_022638, partial [Goodea atripinnis]
LSQSKFYSTDLPSGSNPVVYLIMSSSTHYTDADICVLHSCDSQAIKEEKTQRSDEWPTLCFCFSSSSPQSPPKSKGILA